MHVHDEIAHQGVIDSALRAAFPGRIGARIVWIDADDLELLQILEFRGVECLQLAAEYQMEQLLRSCFGHVLILARLMRTPASLPAPARRMPRDANARRRPARRAL